MPSVWSELLPLALASMVVPVQWTLTILIVRTSRLRALAFVLGNVTVRLMQGVLFFLVIPEPGDGGSEPSAGVAWLLLIVGTLLLVKALRSLLTGAPDEDAPPPRWIESAATMSAGRAYLVGAGLLAIGAKFWVFTMSAVAVLDTADLPTSTTWSCPMSPSHCSQSCPLCRSSRRPQSSRRDRQHSSTRCPAGSPATPRGS